MRVRGGSVTARTLVAKHFADLKHSIQASNHKALEASAHESHGQRISDADHSHTRTDERPATPAHLEEQLWCDAQRQLSVPGPRSRQEGASQGASSGWRQQWGLYLEVASGHGEQAL